MTNLTWTTPSNDSSGSMPLGNGDIGLNVWINPAGLLLAYLSKTDSWDENGRLLKLGRLQVRFQDSPFVPGQPFEQTLRLEDGAIEINGGRPENSLTLRLWVDANRPVARLEIRSAIPRQVEATFESWRTAVRQLLPNEDYSIGKRAEDEPIICRPDTLIANETPRIYWCHRNAASVWAATLAHQGLKELIPMLADPLTGRTFGAALAGPGLVKAGPTSLRTAGPVTDCALGLYPLTAQASSADAWRAQADASIAACDAVPPAEAWKAHTAWWRAFWARSSIAISGDEAAETVTRGYALQRYLLACAGRGDQPIKFNGSIFTVNTIEGQEQFDADYRRWGSGFWFQNTRLMYWALLMSGDFDLMQAFFRMYRRALPLAEARTPRYFGHAGAFFPETMTFWGTYLNRNYGFERSGKHISEVENPYIRRYWQGILELAFLMLEYFAATQDADFAKNTLLPLARSFVTFFRAHFPRRDENGKVLFAPAQALETWHSALNPLPEIAGLRAVLDGLLALPVELTDAAERQTWRTFREQLPPLPARTYWWSKTREFIPALQYDDCRNFENVALYAVFPYRIAAIGTPELETGRTTYARRTHKQTGGWCQDAIQAALLGLTEDAQRYVVSNFSTHHKGSRFPAFWGPNCDWVPDQDHGSVAMLALQRMLLQWQGSALYLLPAWPRPWEVAFKLHAPGRTTVAGVYRAGRLERLEVNPAARRADVVLPEWLEKEHGS